MSKNYIVTAPFAVSEREYKIGDTWELPQGWRVDESVARERGTAFTYVMGSGKKASSHTMILPVQPLPDREVEPGAAVEPARPPKKPKAPKAQEPEAETDA